MGTNPLYLDYADFIVPRSSVTPILSPSRIPVHPRVYYSKAVYTPEFTDEVKELIPQSIRHDIEIIEQTLGNKIGIEITDQEIVQSFPIRLEAFSVVTNSTQRYVEVSLGSSNIALDTREAYRAALHPYLQTLIIYE